MQTLPAEALAQELAQLCGYSSSNVWLHLTPLMQHGPGAHESRGNSAVCSIADPSVDAPCDLVCGNIARRFERTAAARAAFTLSAAKRTRQKSTA